MKIVFLVGSVNISGGTYVIFEHAVFASDNGHDIYILTEDTVRMDEVAWHTDAHNLKYITYSDVESMSFDLAIATWWKTVFLLRHVVATHYVYFVQSIESRFYPVTHTALRQLVESTYTFGIPAITEATWIKNYLADNYCCDAFLVHNGVRKDIYSQYAAPVKPRLSSGLRVLVEGPLGVEFKNVERTIELCGQSEACEVWLLTSSPISSYRGVDRVFSQVPITDTPGIYTSCDVIVKLSFVEGMFGPPLEAFHCGCTAIVYDVTGHDEYIIDGYNGLVIQCNNEHKVVEAINKLAKNDKYLSALKENALNTALAWPDWNSSSEEFLSALSRISDRLPVIDQNRIDMLSTFHEASYKLCESMGLHRKFFSTMSSCKSYMKNRSPSIYEKVKRLYYAIFKRPF